MASASEAMPAPDSSKYRIVYNDADLHVWNFFRVLRDSPEELVRVVTATPYSRNEFELAVKYIESEDQSVRESDPIEWARNYICFNRQSIFGKETGNWCISRRGENICMTWNDLPPLLVKMASHLKTAYIECLDYTDLIKKWDSPSSLFYVDPPYEGVEKLFYHVNKEKGFDHKELRKFLGNIQGSWAISYYDSEYIRDLYKGYVFYELEVKKSMQTTDSKDSVTELLIVHQGKWAENHTNANSDCFE